MFKLINSSRKLITIAMDTENYIKPVFKKPGDDDFYRDLHQEVKTNVLGKRKYHQQLITKATSFIALFFTFYACILLFGNNMPSLFIFYILLGLTMILVFL